MKEWEWLVVYTKVEWEWIGVYKRENSSIKAGRSIMRADGIV